jgi:hypothetical protein
MAARSGEDIRMENSLSFHSENPSWVLSGKRLVRVTTRLSPNRSPENQAGRITLG